MNFELKPISADAIPEALQKVERYRLLNEPAEAQSICEDILAIEPENQSALVMLILTITDQFGEGASASEAREQATLGACAVAGRLRRHVSAVCS